MKVMIIDERNAHVFMKFFYVYSTLSYNVGIYVDSKSENNCDFNSQELTMSRR